MLNNFKCRWNSSFVTQNGQRKIKSGSFVDNIHGLAFGIGFTLLLITLAVGAWSSFPKAGAQTSTSAPTHGDMQDLTKAVNNLTEVIKTSKCR